MSMILTDTNERQPETKDVSMDQIWARVLMLFTIGTSALCFMAYLLGASGF